MNKTAYLAFGSNMGDAAANIDDAVAALERVPGITVIKVSSYMKTKPWGYKNQNDFMNACARIETNLSPEALLGVCLGIEAGMGRIRKIKNGPRIIDIDLIIYEGEKRDTEELKLPHPEYKNRDFVLKPLSEVAEEPLRASAAECLGKITDSYIYNN